jgi:hypothetical protein
MSRNKPVAKIFSGKVENTDDESSSECLQSEQGYN